MYDALPVAYAVYKVHLGATTKVDDATVIYVNQRFCDLVKKDQSELVNHRVREVFTLSGEWYDFAYRSAILGEKVVEHGYYSVVNLTLNITANQVICPGYCAFTYILPEDYDKEQEAE